MVKRKIGIFFPHFVTGGGEVVTAWSIQALKDDFDVFLFTFAKISPKEINNLYGTKMSDQDLKVVNPPGSFIFRLLPGLGLLKYHCLVAYSKIFRTKMDILFGTYKEIDFGVKGVQYIHFPELDYSNYDLGRISKHYYRNKFLRDAYKGFCYFISGGQESKTKDNITLTNSYWTGKKIKERMGIDSEVVYPPVLNDFPKIDWDRKEDYFVCLGRISPEKRTKLVIEIIDKVRKEGFDVKLRIIGPVGDTRYFKEIKKIQSQVNWIEIFTSVNRSDLVSIVSKSKYGLHGRKDEHFGIGVAEMAKAGCLVFVPCGGGQTEIINSDELIYAQKEDAIRKIINILKDEKLRDIVRDKIKNDVKLFSTDNFISLLKQIILKL